MNTMPFDTHAEIERLRESGLNEKQAKAITQTVRSGVTGGVATKADIAELKGDIGRLETDVSWLKLICVTILGTCSAILITILGIFAKLLLFP